MRKIPVYHITIPEYHAKSRPDWDAIGSKLDKVLKRHFIGKKVAIRCISSKEHPGKTLEVLIRTIQKEGTDRYNPKRKGDKYENVGNKQIDIFCIDKTIRAASKIMWQFVWSFYLFPIEEGLKPVRFDIVLVYDRSKLKRVLHRYAGREDTKTDGFVFKDQKNKPEALLGIIKVL